MIKRATIIITMMAVNIYSPQLKFFLVNHINSLFVRKSRPGDCKGNTGKNGWFVHVYPSLHEPVPNRCAGHTRTLQHYNTTTNTLL